MRIAHRAEQRSMSTQQAADLLDGGNERRVSRRRFLAGTAATVGALAVPGVLLSGCAPRRELRAPGPRIAIVGAGMAGLSCAWELRRFGVVADVFEASESRVGGRMFSLRDHYRNGQVCELGGELVNSEHVTVRGLANELGLAMFDRQNPVFGTNAERFYFEGRWIDEAEILQGFRPIAATLAADLARANDSDEAMLEIDRTNMRDYLVRNGASPLVRAIIESAYTAEMGLEADEQSCLNLLWLIDSSTDHFHVLGESDERYHFKDGNDVLPRTLGDRMADQITFGHRLVAIRDTPRGDYAISFRTDGGRGDRVYEQVVLALPLTLLRECEVKVEMPELKREIIERATYGTNAKLMAGFTRRVWRDDYNSSGSVYTDLVFQDLWDTSRCQPGESGILTNFLGGRSGVASGEGTAEERMQVRLGTYNAMFVGMRDAYIADSAVRMHWPTAPLAKGSYMCLGPGMGHYWGKIGTRVGNVHFAGEHASDEAQGYMEGAAESGVRAAQEILEDMGIDPNAIERPWAIGRRSPRRRTFRSRAGAKLRDARR